jgi:hypothetical protein
MSSRRVVSLERQAARIGRAEDLQLESLERDIELRTMFGKVLLGIAIVVNLATITLVALTGLSLTKLSDKLLITLISSTVAELAGLVLVVAKYLFPAARPTLARPRRRPRRPEPPPASRSSGHAQEAHQGHPQG